ncbi:MAG: SemiSWEET family sugar transporter [Chloroflexota bacterium]
MTGATILGLFAAALSTISFLPQAVQCWRTGRTRDISLSTYCFLIAGNLAWLAYGALRSDLPILITNTVVGFTGVSILILKVRNREADRAAEEAPAAPSAQAEVPVGA